jgi:hypothetical protein
VPYFSENEGGETSRVVGGGYDEIDEESDG